MKNIFINFIKTSKYLFLKLSVSIIVALTLLNSCSSYREFQHLAQELEIPTRIFKEDYNRAWEAVLSVMKSYDIEHQSLEAGVIKTRWIDNTLSLNFADSFGGKDAVKQAQFKIVVNVIKGFKGTKEVSKVTIFKRQLIKEDFLTGWKIVPTDQIQEKTLLYRIERELMIERKLRKIDEAKEKEAEANF